MSRATLPALDSSLYPQIWDQHIFKDAQSLLLALLTTSFTLEPKAFTKQLLANDIYQEWINATVFGRYIQRSFAAFYQQGEDSFNMDMPTLFRHELMRHAQYLPVEQILFVAGDMPKSARQEKLFTSTVNPATAVLGAQKINQNALKSGRANNQTLILNQIRVVGKQVVGFPIRHNKRTSESTRNEVLILDFHDLRLVNETYIEKNGIKTNSSEQSSFDSPTLLRHYDLR